MARFVEGQMVRALTDAQGMTQGERYQVVAVEDLSTPFGTFVTYTLTNGADCFGVRNGHLLLEPVRGWH